MKRNYHLLREAEKALGDSERIMAHTFPLLQEPKLLLSSLEGIFLSFSYAMGYVLMRSSERDEEYSHLSFDDKVQLFKEKANDEELMNVHYLDTIKEIKEILLLHKRSPVEFSRKDKLVICSEDYGMKIIHAKDVTHYLEIARAFLKTIREVIQKQKGQSKESENR